jgi:hypothetical protein
VGQICLAAQWSPLVLKAFEASFMTASFPQMLVDELQQPFQRQPAFPNVSVDFRQFRYTSHGPISSGYP